LLRFDRTDRLGSPDTARLGSGLYLCALASAPTAPRPTPTSHKTQDQQEPLSGGRVLAVALAAKGWRLPQIVMQRRTIETRPTGRLLCDYRRNHSVYKPYYAMPVEIRAPSALSAWCAPAYADHRTRVKPTTPV